jgi:replication factor C subunit 1
MARYAAAASLLAKGDRADRLIRSTQQWSVLADAALLSAVLPVSTIGGHLSAQLAFPTWLGRNSTRNKRARLLQQLHAHMALRCAQRTHAFMHVFVSCSCDQQSLLLDYVPLLRTSLTRPLTNAAGGEAGVSTVLAIYDAYELTRDDADTIVTELGTWPGAAAPAVEPKVKAALTRAFNKSAHCLPYALAIDQMAKGTLADVRTAPHTHVRHLPSWRREKGARRTVDCRR